MNNMFDDKLIANENNIVFYKDEELQEKSTCSKMEQVQKIDGR